MSFISLLSKRGTTDILSTLGPSLIGSTLFYIVLFLAIPTLDSILIITTLAFIIGMVLNAIVPSIIEFYSLSPKRISDQTSNRISNEFKKKMRKEGYGDDKAEKTVSSHIKDILRDETKLKMKEVRYKHKYSQSHTDKTEFESIKGKEIKLGNYLSIWGITLFIILIPIGINGFFNFLPIFQIQSETETSFTITSKVYPYLMVGGIIVFLILTIAIHHESKSLQEMYRAELPFLLPSWQKFGFQLDSELQWVEKQRKKMLIKGDIAPLTSVKSITESNYKTSLEHEIALQNVLSKNMLEFTKKIEAIKKNIPELSDFILNMFDQEYPLSYHDFNPNENALILRKEKKDLEIVKQAIDEAIANSNYSAIIPTLNMLDSPVTNKILILQAFYNRNLLFLNRLDQKTLREIVHLFFQTMRDRSIEELFLAWAIDHDPIFSLGPLLLNHYKRLEQTDPKIRGKSFLPKSNPRLWTRAIAKHSQLPNNIFINDRSYLLLYGLSLTTNDQELSKRLKNLEFKGIGDDDLLLHCITDPLKSLRKHQENTALSVIQALISNGFSKGLIENSKFLEHILVGIVRLSNLSEFRSDAIFNYLAQHITNYESPFSSSSSRLLGSALLLTKTKNFDSLVNRFVPQLSSNLKDIKTIKALDWVKILFSKRRKDIETEFEKNEVLQLIKMPLIDPSDIELSNLEKRNDIESSSRLHDHLWGQFAREQSVLVEHDYFPCFVLVSLLLYGQSFTNISLYNLYVTAFQNKVEELEKAREVDTDAIRNIISFVRVLLFLEKEFNDELPNRDQVVENLRKSRLFLSEEPDMVNRIDNLV